MRRAIGLAVLLSFSLFGCAAAFRSSKETVHIESKPDGAEARRNDTKVGVTPGNYEFDRNKNAPFTLVKPGYEDHYVSLKKSINAGWLVVDILTCVIPVALCIPVLVDALTGAWNDIEPRYVATMRPGTSGPSGSASALASASAAPSSTASATPTQAGGPPPDMSESERKATARAAYLEGVKLQESGNCPEALHRLETAQKFYSAPTHLLHIAECQAATGKLVEASENYETLVRAPLGKDAPEAFRQAQDSGKKELGALKPRIPTLRIQVTPAPNTLSSLVVKLNGNAIPVEVLGIARPVNPGSYKVTVWAAGYKEASVDVDVGEATAKAADLKLAK